MTHERFVRNILLFVFVASNVQGYFMESSKKTPITHKQQNFEPEPQFMEDGLQRKQDRRNRRSHNSNPFKRSSTFRCRGNETVFSYGLQFYCFYDNACFETFHDCCPDYEMQCGKQITVGKPKPNSNFRCVKLGLVNGNGCVIKGPSGVWMIQTCPSTWPFDETKSKCHEALDKFSHPVEDYLPVVGQNQFTYRNKHCAVCHGLTNYTTWNIKVYTYVTPPAEYDLDAKLRFIDKTGGNFWPIYPMPNQPRRYCAGEKYNDGCDNPFHRTYNDCLNGPVEVVVGRKFTYYKNRACALCNGDLTATGWAMAGNCGILSAAFSIVFNIRSPGVPATTSIVSKDCPPGTVYDEIEEFCRRAYITANKDDLSDEFQVVLWLQEASRTNVSYLERHFRTALQDNFNLIPTQASAINFHEQDRRSANLVVTFRLTLTPYQHFILANQNVTNMKISSRSMKFLKLLKFEGNFTLQLLTYRLPVVKVNLKQLACFEGRTLEHGEYQLKKTSGTLIVNKTGERLLLEDYSILHKRQKITLCRKLVLADCINGSYVLLHPNEYVILSNLSLYHSLTQKTFELGEYQINERLNPFSDDRSGNVQNRRGHHGNKQTGFPQNVTFAICLPHKATHNGPDMDRKHTRTNYFLQVLIFTVFGISVTCLLLLLITHALFSELRTLPGMNLMNLSFSILLYKCLWLIGTLFLQNTIWCTVFAILRHYLILVSLFAMSIISYHSCLVFSQSFPVRKSDHGWRTYVRYSKVVWCSPAIFVVICVALDRIGVFTVDYGIECWLGTKNAKLYLFLLPIALLLLFNISAFVRTVVSLSASSRQIQQLQMLRRRRRQNLVACVKLSTLVGFPWIVAFFSVLFPDVVAIKYFFVIAVCLQALYIAVAFLWNKKVFQLYKNFAKRREVGSTESGHRKPAFRIKIMA